MKEPKASYFYTLKIVLPVLSFQDLFRDRLGMFLAGGWIYFGAPESLLEAVAADENRCSVPMKNFIAIHPCRKRAGGELNY